MVKRILVVVLLAPMLALLNPAPAAAHVGFSFSIGAPFFGMVVGTPPYYAPPVYVPPVYAPAYVPAPVYVPAPIYAPPVVYAPRVFVGHPRHAVRAFYRPAKHHGRHW